jgi:hypothetical protein
MLSSYMLRLYSVYVVHVEQPMGGKNPKVRPSAACPCDKIMASIAMHAVRVQNLSLGFFTFGG